MSMFLCKACDNLRDSDDGCEEYEGGLMCEDCMSNREDEIPEDAHVMASGARDMSYEGIYNTLIKAGCPVDIADELAREKSR